MNLASASQDTTATAVCVVLFLAIAALGLFASRWRRAETPDSLEEWGLGGRQFGSWVTWFLLGGDLYTAYTFIAVPGALYALGAVSGWFAVLYAFTGYSIGFLFVPRLWSACRAHNLVSVGDFIQRQYASRALAAVVALTGIIATMPYVALQLVGLQTVLEVMGLSSGEGLMGELPLFVAFLLLAVYTFVSGVRAPALIAFAKDGLGYLLVLIALAYLPWKLGGFDAAFSAAEHKFDGVAAGRFLPQHGDYLAFATLILGSSLALFLYPHTQTGILTARSRTAVRKSMVFLPGYSLMLAFIALLGYFAITADVHVDTPRQVVPALFRQEFPSWLAGVGYATVCAAALVPTALMSIGAANLFTRNAYVALVRPAASETEQVWVSKIASLTVKIGGLFAVLLLDTAYTLNLQLVAGICIIQTAPAVILGLFPVRLHPHALILGWAGGTAYGITTAYQQTTVRDGRTQHFATSIAEVPFLGAHAYLGLTALAVNLALTVATTLLLNRLTAPPARRITAEDLHHA